MCRLLVLSLMLNLAICTSMAETGYFWHVTDFHWDFSYWTDQWSCNGMNISDQGKFGNQWCDSPWKLIKDTVVGINKLKPDVDFILWTGDTVPHVKSKHLSKDINKELVRKLTHLMKTEFPRVPIYATFGNHDYFMTNMFPPHGNDIYNATYLIWKDWINDSTQDINFRKGGYYTVLARPGIRIVAMNSNMYYTKDTVTVAMEDPADQFHWLDSVLNDAATNNEKVILTGHVPPGFATPRTVCWMTKAFNEKFIDIVLRHARVIVAMHFGHEHHDSFRLFYDHDGVPVVSLFLAPSVTPWRYQLADGEVEPAHNPGARLVKYDRRTGKHLDIEQYYVDLNLANKLGHLTWVRGYTVSDLYGLEDVTPRSMGNLADRMTCAGQKDFKLYMDWYNTNASTSDEFQCDDTCFRTVTCGMKYLKQDVFKLCVSGAIN